MNIYSKKNFKCPLEAVCATIFERRHMTLVRNHQSLNQPIGDDFFLFRSTKQYTYKQYLRNPSVNLNRKLKIQIQPVCLPLEEPFNSMKQRKKNNMPTYVRPLKKLLYFLIFYCSLATIHREDAVVLHSLLPVVIEHFLWQQKCENP